MMLHLSPKKLLYLNVVARVVTYRTSALCPLASAEPISVGAGESASEGYRPDLLQDVLDQGHHVLISGAHVSGLASGFDCKV